MKNRTLLWFAFCVVTLSVLGGISIDRYDEKKQPTIQLPEAYVMAIHTLGPKTNGLYCTKAFLTIINGAAQWQFHFYCTNGNSEGVSVYLDRNHKPELNPKGVGY